MREENNYKILSFPFPAKIPTSTVNCTGGYIFILILFYPSLANITNSSYIAKIVPLVRIS